MPEEGTEAYRGRGTCPGHTGRRCPHPDPSQGHPLPSASYCSGDREVALSAQVPASPPWGISTWAGGQS